MIEHYNHFLPRLMKVRAVTLGRHVFYAIDSKMITNRLRAHEMVHIEQYKKIGFFLFLYRYFKEYIFLRGKGYEHFNAYLNISFEKEAREKEIVKS
ncbi:MAG: hypothetical protein Q8T08_20160 [Ignavibacteria bacterium]|nr:hypothetical protein [Ignavibacteria bacterium]